MVALRKLPREHDLLVAHAALVRDCAERVELRLILRFTESTKRTPAHEADADARRMLKRIRSLRIDWRILVLHRDERVPEDFLCDVHLFDRRVRYARLSRDALVDELLDRFDRLPVRHTRIRTVEIQQIDCVDTERECAFLRTTDQVFRGAVDGPRRFAVGEVTIMPDFCRDEHFVLRTFPARHRVAHKLLARLFLTARAVVRPRGVDLTAARVERRVNRLDAHMRTEVVLDRQRHFAEPYRRRIERSHVPVQYHRCSFAL